MNDSLSSAIDALEKLFPDGFDSIVVFEIVDVGTILLDSSGVREGSSASDCVMKADIETFAGMLSGELDPAKMYFSGKLRVYGDMGIAMRLGRHLS